MRTARITCHVTLGLHTALLLLTGLVWVGVAIMGVRRDWRKIFADLRTRSGFGL